VKKFNTVEKMAPIAKNCTGSYSTTMTVQGDLDSKMSPVMNSLTGSGKLLTSKVVIDNFPAFVKVADALKMDSWKKFEIPPVSPSFKFANGRVYVDPFEMNVNGIKSTVAGSNGFDQTIDYTMASEIPRSVLGGNANSLVNGLLSSANAKGANLSVGDVIPVVIHITGTATDPKVGTDLNKAGAKAMDDLKAKAADEFNKKKAEAEAKAKEEAEKLKKEAQAKAQAEADRLKKEAEAKAKAEADRLKKEAEQKAKDQLKNIFKK
jgi:Skp family chaperone for outer membrane proteins